MSSMQRLRRSNGKGNGSVRRNGRFVLYVEGPRDQSLLAADQSGVAGGEAVRDAAETPFLPPSPV